MIVYKSKFNYLHNIYICSGYTLSQINNSIIKRATERVITNVIEQMCIAEIEQAQNQEISKQDYLNIIEGKTAAVMRACCKLGAEVVEAKEEEIIALENYGLNLGMAYEIMDDCIDGDCNDIFTTYNYGYVINFYNLSKTCFG